MLRENLKLLAQRVRIHGCAGLTLPTQSLQGGECVGPRHPLHFLLEFSLVGGQNALLDQILGEGT